jgi:hypothetical protein
MGSIATDYSYAVGPYGWVMTTAWVAASSGCLMLTLGLARSGPHSGAARVGTLLMGILSLGIMVTAIFPPGQEGGAIDLGRNP